MVGRRYRSSDLEEVSSWYEKRGMRCLPDLLPPVGFVVPGIAAGFIMCTDTKAVLLEPFIANPDALQGEREDALTWILHELTSTAKSFGATHVFGFSTSPSMIRRAISEGFKVTEHSITVVKEF